MTRADQEKTRHVNTAQEQPTAIEAELRLRMRETQVRMPCVPMPHVRSIFPAPHDMRDTFHGERDTVRPRCTRFSLHAMHSTPLPSTHPSIPHSYGPRGVSLSLCTSCSSILWSSSSIMARSVDRSVGQWDGRTRGTEAASFIPITAFVTRVSSTAIEHLH